MSRQRELVRARDRVLEAVGRHAGHDGPWIEHAVDEQGPVQLVHLPMRLPEDVKTAWKEYDAIRQQMDAPGASSGRHTSIAASRNLSAVTTWRGKVQEAVFNAGKARPSRVSDDIVGGTTTDQLEARLHGPHQSVSSAVNYCENAGFIRDSGYTRQTRHGQRAIIYEPTELLMELMKERRRVA